MNHIWHVFVACVWVYVWHQFSQAWSLQTRAVARRAIAQTKAASCACRVMLRNNVRVACWPCLQCLLQGHLLAPARHLSRRRRPRCLAQLLRKDCRVIVRVCLAMPWFRIRCAPLLPSCSLRCQATRHTRRSICMASAIKSVSRRLRQVRRSGNLINFDMFGEHFVQQPISMVHCFR